MTSDLAREYGHVLAPMAARWSPPRAPCRCGPPAPTDDGYEDETSTPAYTIPHSTGGSHQTTLSYAAPPHLTEQAIDRQEHEVERGGSSSAVGSEHSAVRIVTAATSHILVSI